MAKVAAPADDELPIRCIHCGKEVRIKGARPGDVVLCPKCGKEIRIGERKQVLRFGRKRVRHRGTPLAASAEDDDTPKPRRVVRYVALFLVGAIVGVLLLHDGPPTVEAVLATAKELMREIWEFVRPLSEAPEPPPSDPLNRPR